MSGLSESEIKHIQKIKNVLKDLLFQTENTYINNFLKSNHAYLSGGCIGSLLRGEHPNDFDFYFPKDPFFPTARMWIENNRKIVASIEEAYRMKGGNTDRFEGMDKDYRNGPAITECAITLKNKYQLIIKHYGSPDEVRKTFDYVHCLPYYDIVEDKLYISKEQYDLNMKKRCVINNKTSVVGWREDKFRKLGWSILNSQYELTEIGG